MSNSETYDRFTILRLASDDYIYGCFHKDVLQVFNESEKLKSKLSLSIYLALTFMYMNSIYVTFPSRQIILG